MAHGNNLASSKELLLDEFIANQFSITGQDIVAREKRQLDLFDQHMQGKAVQQGTLTEAQVSTTLAFTIASNAKINEDVAAKRKQATADFLLLEEITRLHDRANALMDGLKDKYGDDVIGGLAETYLSDEELAEAKTPAEKKQALIDKLLDDDGNLKPEYVGIVDPETLELVKIWRELQMKAQEVNQKVENNGLKVTPEVESILEDAVTKNDTAGEIELKKNLDTEVAKTAATDHEDRESDNAAISGALDFSKLV